MPKLLTILTTISLTRACTLTTPCNTGQLPWFTKGMHTTRFTMARLMNSQSVKGIMNKRTLIPASAVGKRVKVTIQGNGNVIDVKNKEGEFVPSIADPNLALQKKIFNCKAVSATAMASDRNRQILKDAIAAEKAGDAEKASGLFNDYLNKVQLTFGVLLPNAKADKLTDGMEIAAVVEQITTENGSLLSLDPSTIAILEPETYGKVSFSLDGFDDEEEAEEVETPTSVEETI